MKKITIKQKSVIIPFCEGEAEINLFGFLKSEYSSKAVVFKKPINLYGFNNLDTFKRKYFKCCKAQNLKPKKDFLSVQFLFIFDNDLADSEKIKEFLEQEKCYVQQCDPNVEGLILGMVGKKIGPNLKTEDFRKNCKDKFQKYFGCEAHRLKDKKLQEIFMSEKDFVDNFPTLHVLFKN
ncbi:MAG: hypothetical protein UR66_C0004G0045 [Candidatus Moranbacteria bacterium GW2011_GWE1_35_17]|nr:MAG: hypothetical protein UR66_C0004G0045 [Candidatus Moranbacteria bacterium GW2011_GWE1_35_17]KKP72859.1 MAG: hypothetical protein UR65_C0011G0009 [Candidatus Moranbacteria bacterium GW2011_GWE2_35_164]KKP84080.1 MAG: hypothetical protein UR82_C0013G0007 [Candidatus Moranbacteria bacterium GW2011_GWF1_35_5]KKP85040.1 MAG: hypothetical protein UR83_C0006G0042 [Candidatus Moranbacteria bacterium GW2011_GWF2_35_54]